MVTLNVAVYSISTGLPIPNATITIDATPQPSVGIALYGTKRLVRITDANGQVLIDSTAFGFLVYDDGMYWSWSAAAAANGYVTSSSATSSTPGNNTYIVIKLPTAATTAPAPTITSTMAPTSGGIIIPAIPNPLTDAITQTDTAVNKTISTVSKTLIIGAIVLGQVPSPRDMTGIALVMAAMALHRPAEAL